MKKIQRYTTEYVKGFTQPIKNWCMDVDVAELEAENKWLQHEYDSTCGLWCTDRPDLIPENIKHLFFQLGDK